MLSKFRGNLQKENMTKLQKEQMKRIKIILGRETRGLNLTEKDKEWFRIFSYNDVEKLMEELIR